MMVYKLRVVVILLSLHAQLTHCYTTVCVVFASLQTSINCEYALFVDTRSISPVASAVFATSLGTSPLAHSQMGERLGHMSTSSQEFADRPISHQPAGCIQPPTHGLFRSHQVLHFEQTQQWDECVCIRDTFQFSRLVAIQQG
eukprot:m.55654 g.55654  ORF g.55654 m.55654 type:complete len:143 (+) comp11503_c0_seq2:198-626(+)